MSRGVPPRKNRFWPPGCQRKILLAFLLVVPFFNVLNSLRIIPKSQDDVWPQLEAKALKNYSQKQQRYSPTFLWGIPSTEDEAGRRQVVRETYLSFYKETNEPNRICALTDLQNHIIPFEDCQIAYVFFLGGNPNGPTELVKPNASFPIVMDTSKDEQDVVFLNIKENLEDGKSQTWLKYASMVHQEFPFDYVTKVDSDTIVFTPAFLQFAENSIPHRPNNELIYGGIPHTRSSCDPWINDTHPCPLELVGDVYMGGAFYWMSLDLASFVTSDALDRSSLTIRHEDVDIGNFVFSHKKTVKTIRVKPDNVLIHRLVDGDWGLRDKAYTFREVYWGHSESGFWPGPFFKREHHFRKMWRQFQAYWFSNKTLYVSDKKIRKRVNEIIFSHSFHSFTIIWISQTKDIYQLFDLPYNDSKVSLHMSNPHHGSETALFF